MRVGIDVTAVQYSRGVSRYTSNLVRALADYTPVKLSLLGYSWRNKAQLTAELQRLVPKGAGHQIKVESFPVRLRELWWHTLGLSPVKKLLPGVEVFHAWDWYQPPDKNLPIVSTIHDLAILRYPETAHPSVVRNHRHAWQTLKQRHAHVIAVSQATRQDIIELLEYPPQLIHVVHEALPVEFKHISDSLTEEAYEQLRVELRLDKPYILFVGTREPRKNLMRLIKAWEPLAKDYQLIIAGESGWDETATMEKQSSQLRFIGKVNDRQLAVLYGEAATFAYPSLSEGFGLPILEAFYHGTPVLTSDRSAMAEVAGNAAMLVNPDSVEAIRQGLKELLSEPPAAQKQRLQRMIIRLQLFNWRQIAKETVAVYQQALADYQ